MRAIGDDDVGGVWMTYDEISAARKIKRVAAIRLVQRHQWRRQAGNDGLARDIMLRLAREQDQAPLPRRLAVLALAAAI